MDPNPYEGPKAIALHGAQQGFPIGNIGLSLSLAGVLGVFAVGWTPDIVSLAASYAAFSCLPGVFLSFVGYVARPTRLAAWGIGTGLFGSCYLPTIWFGLTRH